APERLVWGSDWPHPSEQRKPALPDDAVLFDLLAQWAPDEAVRNRILVDNPAKLYGFSSWKNGEAVDRLSQSEGISRPPTLPVLGATLVVARSAHRVRRQQGDHRGRPYDFIVPGPSQRSQTPGRHTHRPPSKTWWPLTQ